MVTIEEDVCNWYQLERTQNIDCNPWLPSPYFTVSVVYYLETPSARQGSQSCPFQSRWKVGTCRQARWHFCHWENGRSWEDFPFLATTSRDTVMWGLSRQLGGTISKRNAINFDVLDPSIRWNFFHAWICPARAQSLMNLEMVRWNVNSGSLIVSKYENVKWGQIVFTTFTKFISSGVVTIILIYQLVP